MTKVAVVINGRFPAAAEDVRSILERSPKIGLTIEAASGRTSEDKGKVGKYRLSARQRVKQFCRPKVSKLNRTIFLREKAAKNMGGALQPNRGALGVPVYPAC